MRVLHIGNPWPVAALRELGHDVVEVFARFPEVAVPGRPCDVGEIWARLDATADVVLVVDTLGRQTLAYGLEKLPVPCAYHAIDIHLNHFWQRHYARLFDLVLLAQKDYVPLLAAEGVWAEWLPAAVDTGVCRDHGMPRVHDVAFVGVVDPATRLKRTALLDVLREHFDVAVFGATPAERLSMDAMARVFSATKIVVNEAVLGDLNFRVFEAMACGAMLLSEDIGNGLRDLFTPGVHLDVFTPGTLIARVRRYLASPDERTRVAAAGAALVCTRHDVRARARELVDLLAALRAEHARPRSGAGAKPDERSQPNGNGVDAALGVTLHLTVVRGLTDAAAGARLAAEHLRRALLDDGNTDAALALGEIMMWAGRPAGARAVLAEARRLRPGDVRGWFVAAELERTAGDGGAAAALFAAGIDAAEGITPPTRARARDAVAAGIARASCWHALGLVLQEAGLTFTPGLVRLVGAELPRTALDYFMRAVEIDPTDRAAAASAAALLDYVRLPEFAAQFHESIVGAAPADLEARRRLCAVLFAAYRWRETRHHARVIAGILGVELGGDGAEERAEVDAEVGTVLRQRGAGARAVVLLDRAAAALPPRGALIAERALAHLDVGDHHGAETCLRDGMRDVPEERAPLGELLALVRAVSGQPQAAPSAAATSGTSSPAPARCRP